MKAPLAVAGVNCNKVPTFTVPFKAETHELPTRSSSIQKYRKFMMFHQKKIKFFILIAVCLICLAPRNVVGLHCYTCSYVDPSSDKTCITEPDSEGQRTTMCSMKYCTIQRQEYLNPPGKVVSFIRSCENKPLYLNEVLTDATYKMYYRSCTTDLCNDGDALYTTSNADPDFGAGENLIVKGKSSAATRDISALLLGGCILIQWITRVRNKKLPF